MGPEGHRPSKLSKLFIRTYFKDIQISIKTYSLFSDLKYMEHFLKNSIEREHPLGEIGAKLSPYILEWNIFSARRQNLMPKIRQKEIVNYVSEQCRFSMSLMHCENDAFQLESMRDILRMNLWGEESLDNLFLYL